METLESLKEQRKKLDEKIKEIESKQLIICNNVRIRADGEYLDIRFGNTWRTVEHTIYNSENTFADRIRQLIGDIENALKCFEENEA